MTLLQRGNVDGYEPSRCFQMRCGISLNRFFPVHHNDRTVEGRASLIARASPALSLSFAAALPWQMLPQELGCGTGMTCWRRLRDWQLAKVWDLIHFAMLDWLARNDQIDWSRAVVDSCSVRAVYGGTRPVRIQPIGPSAGANAI